MATLDGAKEELGWLKVIFAVSAAIDASLIAWLAQKYNSGDRVLVVLAFIGALALTVYGARINTLAYRRIRQLESSQ
jgi:4-hydroxybenzoate polyprenyltransferase